MAPRCLKETPEEELTGRWQGKAPFEKDSAQIGGILLSEYHTLTVKLVTYSARTGKLVYFSKVHSGWVIYIFRDRHAPLCTTFPVTFPLQP